MEIGSSSDASNVVRFPMDRRERPSVELVTRLAPPRSLVDTLIAERDDAPHDAKAGFAREIAYRVRALEAGHGRDDATIQLRRLVDAHMAHAAEVCRAYQDAADRLVSIEVQVARAECVPSPVLLALHSARAEVWGRAIAARVAADDALGRGDGAGQLYPAGTGRLAGQRGAPATAPAVRWSSRLKPIGGRDVWWFSQALPAQ
jgi:hypothetical protein